MLGISKTETKTRNTLRFLESMHIPYTTRVGDITLNKLELLEAIALILKSSSEIFNSLMPGVH